VTIIQEEKRKFMGGDLIAGALGNIGKNLVATEKLEEAAALATSAAAATAKAAMKVGMKMSIGRPKLNASGATGGSAKRMEALE